MAAGAENGGKDLDALYELIAGIEMAMLTTRRRDGQLVSRAMQTQEHDRVADLWFVTSEDTHKLEELEHDPHVNVSYLDGGTKEWVSVSGTATISRDREMIRELYSPDWRAWLQDEGGERDGGPGDPRIVLILVEAESVSFLKSDVSRPRMLFEVAKGIVTGERPNVGEVHHLEPKKRPSEA